MWLIISSSLKKLLWEGDEDKKRLHLLKCEDVAKHKQRGSLGVGRMQNKNVALLSNAGGDLGKKRTLLFGERPSQPSMVLGLSMVFRAKISGVWRSIAKLGDMHLESI